jgi:branched-chain amino acid transport system ATP-binding protein
MSTSATTPLLCISNISSFYGPIKALNDVSIDIYSGEIVTLLGSNGAGKSTLLMATSGIQPISSGSISFDSRNLAGIPAHERAALGLAQVPEGRRIFPRLSVYDNLVLGAYAQRNSNRSDFTLERVFTLFPILHERQAQLGGTLSGGEQQMLAIGRALMSHPRLLLLDEPSMGIAPLLVQKIFEALRVLHSEGLTIFLVEQNAHAALALSSRAYVLETGRITISDSSAVLQSDPRVQEAYLGGM